MRSSVWNRHAISQGCRWETKLRVGIAARAYADERGPGLTDAGRGAHVPHRRRVVGARLGPVRRPARHAPGARVAAAYAGAGGLDEVPAEAQRAGDLRGAEHGGDDDILGGRDIDPQSANARDEVSD